MKLKSTPRASNVNVSPYSFKISKNDKTMNVKKDHDGEMVFEREDHSINFSFNRQIRPKDKNKESTNKMISDVIGTPRSAGGSKGPAPTSKKKQVSINDMD